MKTRIRRFPRSGIRRKILLAVSILLLTASAGAATITGTVTGPGGLYEGARVVALGGDQSVLTETTTDVNGEYTLEAPPGVATMNSEAASPGEGLVGLRLQDVDFSFDREIRLFLVPEVTITATVDLPEGMVDSFIEINALADLGPGAFASVESLAAGVQVPAGAYAIQVTPPCLFISPDIFSCQSHKYFAYKGVDARAGSVDGVVVPRAIPGARIAPTNPPVASLITVSAANVDGIATITGAAGAMNGVVSVAVFNLFTGQINTTASAADGSFEIDMFAPPGSHVAVHQDPTGKLNFAGGEQLAAATIVSVPAGVNVATAFASVKPIHFPPETSVKVDSVGAVDNGQVWIGGDLADHEWTQGDSINLAGTVNIYSNHIADLTTGEVNIQGKVFLERIFDPAGKQELATAEFISNTLTPSLFPIDRADAADAVFLGDLVFGSLVKNGTSRMDANWTAAFDVPLAIPDGVYQLVFNPNVNGIPADKTFFDRVYRTKNGPPLFSLGTGFQIQVGTPGPRKLSWALAMNEFSNGSRGTVAREDQDRFQIAGHVSINSRDFILPMFDSGTGLKKVYRLEPYAPLISASNRGWLSPLTVPFDYPTGELEVTINKPDGGQSSLGPVAFAQPFVQEASSRIGNRLGNGSNFPSQYFGLTTLDQQFEVEFDQYGHHEISMTGAIEDIWGNVYTGGGTYDVYIARTLDLETGVFPSTPYEVGDTFAPALIIQPGVPADVEIRVQVFPESDPLQMVETLIQGRANRYGYFHPSEQPALVMSTPGEYRVDYKASYRDENGVFWMGSQSWGSVIETPGSPLIAHGKRNRDNQGNKSQWYTSNTTTIGGTHLLFPYHNGDVAWMYDLESDPTFTADTPAMTIQDTQGDFGTMVQQRIEGMADYWDRKYFLDDAFAIGEIPMWSTTSSGLSPVLKAAENDTHWSYFYAGAARPGVRVREMVTENEADNGYWRFGDPYNFQLGSGSLGDLVNDFKFHYGGAVYRAPDQDFYYYGAYGSMFVLIPPEDTGGVRIFPPFQGNGGGPSGGPIMTLKGDDIDMFFHLTGIRPGSILELGNTVSLSGALAPTLPSQVSITVTSPGAAVTNINGLANKVGYFHDAASDFDVNEPGRWTVNVLVTHNGQTSAGPTTMPYPTGDVLGSSSGEFHFYVVDSFSEPLAINLPSSSLVRPAEGPIAIPVTALAGLSNVELHYTVVMPGFILDQGSQASLTYSYDSPALHADFPNLDQFDQEGAAGVDTITMSFLLSGTDGEGQTVYRARQLLLQGEKLILPAQRSRNWVFGHSFEK